VSAFSDVQNLYDKQQLGEIIALCSDCGFVYAEHDTFVCAYPVFRRNINNIIEIKYKKELDKTDTWFIFIASGDLKKAYNMIPKKKYVAFERFDGKLRVFDFEKLRRSIWAVK
jgi:hypothetical protein